MGMQHKTKLENYSEAKQGKLKDEWDRKRKLFDLKIEDAAIYKGRHTEVKIWEIKIIRN